MASKRQRGNTWEFTVKRAGLLEKPLVLNFRSEEEGVEYCKRLEGLLDRGIIPDQYRPHNRITTIGQLFSKYIDDSAVKQKDREVLRALEPLVGKVGVLSVNANWVDGLIASMKQEHHYKPGTIRSKIGAMARCTDWAIRKGIINLPDHPFRTLPEGYASYNHIDEKIVGRNLKDEERELRLDEDGRQEAAIRAVIAAGVIPRRYRPRTIDHPEKVEALFTLALETAMRLSEMYTLTWDQVFIEKRFVWLDRTKNGDSRQVPLTSVAMETLSKLSADSRSSLVFPWWNGHNTPVSRKHASNYLSSLFSAIFEAAGCPEVRFHDLRHEATSRLFERTTLAVEEIMKITGHRDHRMMMRYLKLRESRIAAKLW